MKKKSSSIRRKINSVLFIQGSIILLCSFIWSASAFRSFFNSLDTARNIKISNQLLQGLIDLSFERSLSQIGLSMNTVFPPEYMRLLDSQRINGDIKINEALEEWKSVHSKESTIAISNIKSLIEDLDNQREEVNRLLAKESKIENLKFIESFPYNFPRILEGIESNRKYLSLNSNNLKILDLLKIVELSWEIREFSGRERTYWAISSMKKELPSKEEMERIKLLRQRAKVSWDKLNIIMETRLANTEITSDYQKAKKNHQLDYAQFILDFEKNALSRDEYPNFDELFKISQNALVSVEDLGRIAGKNVIDSIDEERKQNIYQITFSILIVIISIFLYFFLLKKIKIEVIDRIISATNVLHNLTEGNSKIKFNGKSSDSIEIQYLVDVVTKLIELKSINDFTKQQLQSTSVSIENTIENILSEVQNQSIESDEISTSMEEVNSNIETISEMMKQNEEKFIDIQNFQDILNKELNEIFKNLSNSQSSFDKLSEFSMESEQALVTMKTSFIKVEKSSEEMTKVLEIIKGISEQINLLSLNASIEAARAGQNGRGFSVVASEISKLADSTEDAIVNISSLIKENSIEIHKGMDKVEITEKAISNSNISVNEVSKTLNHLKKIIYQLIDTTGKMNTNLNEYYHLMSSVSNASYEEKAAVNQVAKSVHSFHTSFHTIHEAIREITNETKILNLTAKKI